MKLIDKDAVLAIIEEKLSYYKDLEDREIISDCGIAGYRVVKRLKSDIESLEMKEVDLEKEIEEYAYSLPHGTTGSCSYVSDKRLPIARQFGIKHNWDYEKVENIAEHFFELGMAVSNKAQKGK